jgi:hypothetical protein
VSLVLDLRGFTFGIYRGELLELVLSAMASLAVHMQESGFPVAFYVNSGPPVALAPGASVGHLQHVLESMARLQAIPGPPLLPWALGAVPRGSTVVLAVSEMSSDLSHMLARFADAGFNVIPIFAVSRSPGRVARPGVIYLTPGADVAAALEGHA